MLGFIASTLISIAIDRAYLQKDEYSTFSLADIEAQSDIIEDLENWYNRKDYICVDGWCVAIGYRYESMGAKKVAEGKGYVAHTWDCPNICDNESTWLPKD